MAFAVFFLITVFSPLGLSAAVGGTCDDPVQCFADPCQVHPCEDNQVCEADYCHGGCDRECFETCKEGDKTYKVGESYPSSDGCNDCSCISTGLSACTKRACIVAAAKPGTCPTLDSGFTTCDVQCSNDYECDGTQKCCSWGCSIRCKPPLEECPVFRCMACTTGYVKDDNGCDSCTCKDPACEGIACKSGETCQNGVCCPENLPYVLCKANPCDTKKCRGKRVCRASQCGGCTAECVKP